MLTTTPRCDVVNLDLIGSFNDNKVSKALKIQENAKTTKISTEILVSPYEENKSEFGLSKNTSNHKSYTEFNTVEHDFECEEERISKEQNPYYTVSIKSINKMKEEYERQLQEQITINDQLRIKIQKLEEQLSIRASESNHSEIVMFQTKEYVSQNIQTDEEIKSKTSIKQVDCSIQVDPNFNLIEIQKPLPEDSKIESNSSKKNESKIQPKILQRAKTESESIKVHNLQDKLK